MVLPKAGGMDPGPRILCCVLLWHCASSSPLPGHCGSCAYASSSTWTCGPLEDQTVSESVYMDGVCDCYNCVDENECGPCDQQTVPFTCSSGGTVELTDVGNGMCNCEACDDERQMGFKFRALTGSHCTSAQSLSQDNDLCYKKENRFLESIDSEDSDCTLCSSKLMFYRDFRGVTTSPHLSKACGAGSAPCFSCCSPAHGIVSFEQIIDLHFHPDWSKEQVRNGYNCHSTKDASLGHRTDLEPFLGGLDQSGSDPNYLTDPTEMYYQSDFYSFSLDASCDAGTVLALEFMEAITFILLGCLVVALGLGLLMRKFLGPINWADWFSIYLGLGGHLADSISDVALTVVYLFLPSSYLFEAVCFAVVLSTHRLVAVAEMLLKPRPKSARMVKADIMLQLVDLLRIKRSMQAHHLKMDIKLFSSWLHEEASSAVLECSFLAILQLSLARGISGTMQQLTWAFAFFTSLLRFLLFPLEIDQMCLKYQGCSKSFPSMLSIANHGNYFEEEEQLGEARSRSQSHHIKVKKKAEGVKEEERLSEVAESCIDEFCGFFGFSCCGEVFACCVNKKARGKVHPANLSSDEAFAAWVVGAQAAVSCKLKFCLFVWRAFELGGKILVGFTLFGDNWETTQYVEEDVNAASSHVKEYIYPKTRAYVANAAWVCLGVNIAQAFVYLVCARTSRGKHKYFGVGLWKPISMLFFFPNFGMPFRSVYYAFRLAENIAFVIFPILSAELEGGFLSSPIATGAAGLRWLAVTFSALHLLFVLGLPCAAKIFRTASDERIRFFHAVFQRARQGHLPISITVTNAGVPAADGLYLLATSAAVSHPDENIPSLVWRQAANVGSTTSAPATNEPADVFEIVLPSICLHAGTELHPMYEWQLRQISAKNDSNATERVRTSQVPLCCGVRSKPEWYKIFEESQVLYQANLGRSFGLFVPENWTSAHPSCGNPPDVDVVIAKV